jgi:hypothetical protein
VPVTKADVAMPMTGTVAPRRHASWADRRQRAGRGEWVDGEPDYSQKKIGINARVLDGVDASALPIDVKNLW